MLPFISHVFERVSRLTASAGRKKARRGSRRPSQVHARALGIERLEPRTLLAVVADLGDITNPATLRILNDQVHEDTNDVIAFTLGQTAVVRASISDLQAPHLFPKSAQLGIHRGDVVLPEIPLFSEDFSGDVDRDLVVSLPAGTYLVEVNGFVTRFDLAIHADTAPGVFNAGSSNPLATAGRNLGALSTASGVDIREYVGLKGPTTDQIDVYFFEVVKQGTVRVTVDAPAANGGAIDITLFRDFDQDGIFQRGTAEEILNSTDIDPGDPGVLGTTLPAGRYGLVVTLTPTDPTFSQDDNYRLRTSYVVVDGAGNSLAAANNAGAVGSANVTFNDYLSANDRFDIYRFTTAVGGPFAFRGVLSGMVAGSNFELDFIRDLDADGAIDANEVTTSDNAGNANEDLTVAYFAPGTYFVRVRRTAGEGVYTLQFSNRNDDLAGNTLATANNRGIFFGVNEYVDSVTASDLVDIYKFTLAIQSEFDAQLSAMPAGTNANLSLIRDNDGDGVIDPGEILASSNRSGNAVESIARNLTAGTYFVRVTRVSGSPTYKLRIIKDSAGGTLATAESLSPNGGGELEFLGSQFDDADVYRFTLGSTRLVGIAVGSNNEPLAVRLGQDTNGNGVLDGAELRIDKIVGAGAGGLNDRINLSAGTYFLLVNAVIQDEGTGYHVTIFNEKPDNAGNTLAAARNLSTLSSERIFKDFVGDGLSDLMDDLDDFYRFTVGTNGPFAFNAQLTNLTANANLQLIRDDNLNGEVDFGEVLATTTTAGTAADVLVVELRTPGTHYLRVFRAVGQADYSLSMSAASKDTAGNSLGAAATLGSLANTINSANHFVGLIDLDDFFRFSVNSPGELLASLSGAAASLNIEVIRDIDNDRNIDSGETLATSAGILGRNDLLNGVFLPAAGTYYARVLTSGVDSGYTLGLTFSIQTPFTTPIAISATAPTRIEAENFDKGGEGVAYHDTTADNGGNNSSFRSGENIDVDVSFTSDGGRRVTNTTPGEFLEYTLNVAESGFYDLEVRLASPDPGASFHFEIDGSSTSSPIAVPDTGGADDMETLVAQLNAFITGGPHILRLAVDTGTGFNNNFAGAFNFITVRPVLAGTFELTPPASVVTAGDHAKLALSWTVPAGGWRVLKQIDFRLRDDRGRLIWIRFDEATNSISLYNQASGKFGPAKQVGSNSVLSGPLADLYLSTTTVAADGPDAPTVVFTLDLRFKTATGGHYTAEAAASDDLGHENPFTFAGVLEVRGR